VAASHTVPSNAGAGDFFTLTFTSGSESASATTTSNQIYGVSISQTGGSEPSTINPGDSFTIEYTVTNTGNGGDSVYVSFNAVWLSAVSGTSLSLAGGASGIATATLTVPDSAASSSSSSISASVTTVGGATDNTDNYNITVNSLSRYFFLSGVDSYIINPGSSTEGTVTVTNEGVTATFVVTATSDNVNFTTSEISLGAGEDGNMSFTLHAGVSGGPFNFTIVDTIDSKKRDFSGTVTARVFDMSLVIESTHDCGNEGVTCVIDSEGWWDGIRYTKAGTWSTTKTVVDEFMMSGTKTFDTTIPNSAPSFAPPSLDELVGWHATAGTSQTFTFSMPSDSDGTITRVVVEFGDGNSQIFENSVNPFKPKALDGNSITATHTYAESGVYMISVSAYDNLGAVTRHAVTINVADIIVTMDNDDFWLHFGVLIFMAALGSLLSVSAFSIHRSEIPEMVHELEVLISEGIDNQEIHDTLKRLNGFQGIPLFSNSVNECRKLLSKNNNLKLNINKNMTELSNLREELYKMKNAGMSIEDLESLVHELELQLAQQAQEDSSIKYLETLQNKFVENQDFEE
jgi:hypothetical protein